MAKPEGVRIVRTDGTELECELIQREPEDGMDVWEVTGVVFREGDKLQCAMLPPRTSITVASDIGRLRKEWR